jgi:beta-glucosidase
MNNGPNTYLTMVKISAIPRSLIKPLCILGFGMLSLGLRAQKIYKHKLLSDKRAWQMADSLLSKMTLEQKISLCHKGQTHEQVDGIPQLNIPDFRFCGATNAIYPAVTDNNYFKLKYAPDDTADMTTALPTTTALAATWSTMLAGEFGEVLGQEARNRNFDLLMGGAMNIIRTPLNGRNFEYMSEDPCLTSELIVPMVKAIQQNDVAATVKHFALNNQEKNRFGVNVTVDERTLHEIYLPAFEAAVKKGGVLTVMSAYNKFDGQYCSENKNLLTDILKNEWGFKGFVHSDWGSVHNTVAPALAGLDMEVNCVPLSDLFWGGSKLVNSVKEGKVSEKLINDKVRRILYVMAKIHMFQPETRTKGQRNTPACKQTAFDIAAQSIVLLKNEMHVLPLSANNCKKILVVGDLAKQKHATLGGSSAGKPPYEITPWEGIANRLKQFGPAIDFDTIPAKDVTAAYWEHARQYDAVLVFVGHSHKEETEGTDLVDLQMPAGQDNAVKSLLSINKNTIVINQSGTALEMPWVESAKTLVHTWFAGQEAGSALAAMLFGKVNPSGKLPFTMPVKLADTPPAYLNNYDPLQTNYTEGLLVGYRWYEEKNIKPMFPFGYGLSYTQFDFKSLQLPNTINADKRVAVKLTLTNSGTMEGAEVVQLYLHAPSDMIFNPQQTLKAFNKISLKPKESKTVTLYLEPRDFSYWDEHSHSWKALKGKYEVRIGAASNNIRLRKWIEVK